MTGAVRSIGLETTLVFASAGYIVFATMFLSKKTLALQSIIHEEMQPIFPAVLDVDSDSALQATSY
jgi:NAD(P)-dependent dehydrogenase (short-subunit alcohol dehydrogenase family)